MEGHFCRVLLALRPAYIGLQTTHHACSSSRARPVGTS